MADPKDPSKLPKKEQEYEFSEEEYASDSMLKKKTIFQRFTNRRILIPIILLIAVFIVYQFVGKPKEPKEEIVSQTPPIQPAPMEPAPSITPPVIEAPAPEAPSQLSVLTQQVQNSQLQIRELRTSLLQMQNSVTQLSGQVAGLNNMVNALTQSMAKPVKVAKIHKKPAPKPPVYHVRSIMPGRAWLQTGDKLVTVRVGDFLPGYGRIQSISPPEGKVVTSWGSVIRFGTNDK